MSSTRFILLVALISAALANPLGSTHQRRSGPPEGFSAVGFSPQDETITFRIALTQKDLPGLEKALYAAATPGSPQYGQYLTKAQVRPSRPQSPTTEYHQANLAFRQVNEYAAPSAEGVASVSSWLESQGLSPSSMSPSGDWISVKATVSQANRLLQAEFMAYRAEGVDDPVIRTLSYTLPAEVKDYVAAVHPTNVYVECRIAACSCSHILT